MSRFLRGPVKPEMMGFDPMCQFIHQDDMVAAIIAAMGSDDIGVYNVAGESALPWRTVLALSGGRQLSLPSHVASWLLELASTFAEVLPAYMINFTKYPCVISDAAFRQATGWEPKVDVQRTILSTIGEPG